MYPKVKCSKHNDKTTYITDCNFTHDISFSDGC